MKKVLFVAALLLVCFSVTMNAQTKKEERAAKREALKKEREARRAIETQIDSIAFMKAVNALEEGEFVLEANNVTFPNGLVRFVSSNTNYVQMDNGEGVVQTAFSNFAYSPGPNGLGGVTVEGKISSPTLNKDKDGNVYYTFNIQGIAISATVSISLTAGTNNACAQISPNFNGNNMTMTGNLIPISESDVFQGTTW